MFKEDLKALVSVVDGAIGAAIMGMDGIAVDEYCEQEEANLQLIGIEFSSVVKEIYRASESTETGEVGEVIMVCDKKSVIVRKINNDYFVVLVLNGPGNLGKGRFKLRVLVPRLSVEFE
jgi:predicted regulator of Ras-like GTPase activity (Roadblock/LC7/MglB family)